MSCEGLLLHYPQKFNARLNGAMGRGGDGRARDCARISLIFSVLSIAVTLKPFRLARSLELAKVLGGLFSNISKSYIDR